MLEILSPESALGRKSDSRLVVGVIGTTVKVACDYLPHFLKYSKFVFCIIGGLTTVC
jgi:hypothetical protein